MPEEKKPWDQKIEMRSPAGGPPPGPPPPPPGPPVPPHLDYTHGQIYEYISQMEDMLRLSFDAIWKKLEEIESHIRKK